MRKTGRETAKWDDQNWTEYVNWDEFVDKIPLAITYGKGAPIIKKTVYATQWHQHAIEQILREGRDEFRTETDLTRSMFNTAIVMYYNIYIKRKGVRDPKKEFFYNVIRKFEGDWEASDMAHAIKQTNENARRRRKMNILTPEKAQEIYSEMIESLPPDSREEVMDILQDDLKDNVVSCTKPIKIMGGGE